MGAINILARKTRRAVEIWRANGWTGIKSHLRQLRRNRLARIDYQKWIRFDALTEKDRQAIRRRIENFTCKPLISILMPVYNVEEKWLRLCLQSVLGQLYSHWELCVADDCSPAPHIRRILEEYAAKDARIKLVFRETNGHISAASNSALELATGEFCALLDHDDELAEYALYFVAQETNNFPLVDMIYSDEDMIDETGARYDPKFKPDWSPDLFYSLNLITHLSVYRTTILRQIGGFQLGVEGSQDYDLALRVIEQIPESYIRHIPRILYHWRAIPGSVALNSDQKDYAHDAARRALRQHFARRGVAAVVSQGYHNLHRVQYEVPPPAPKVSVISVADSDIAASQAFIGNVLGSTNYPNFELLFVCQTNQISQIAQIKNKFNDPRLSILTSEITTRVELLNLAASQTTGSVLCFLNSGLKILTPDWLTEMVSHALRPEIGAVGAKLYNADNTIQHGGYIIGIKGEIGNAHNYLPKENPGDFVRANVIQNVSAVSAACLAVRTNVFEKVKGFDARHLPNKFYDADFCLRIREIGYRIVWTPYTELSWKSKTNNSFKKMEAKLCGEENYFKEKWKDLIIRDPYYNPNLSLRDETFAIQIPPPTLMSEFKS